MVAIYFFASMQKRQIDLNGAIEAAKVDLKTELEKRPDAVAVRKLVRGHVTDEQLKSLDERLTAVRAELVKLWAENQGSIAGLSESLSKVTDLVGQINDSYNKQIVIALADGRINSDELRAFRAQVKDRCDGLETIIYSVETAALDQGKSIKALEQEAKEAYETVKMLYHDYADRRAAGKLTKE
jgi:hypothetical protein